jgi:hypothetical protein
MRQLLFILLATFPFCSLISQQGTSKQGKETENQAAYTCLSKEQTAKIKAVLIVGPSIGSTKDAIEQMSKIKDYLCKLGAQVTEVYEPCATWNSVVAASLGAHILVYAGHGIRMGTAGSPGGFRLSADDVISSATITAELKLHKNAIILFKSVCMGAGSSATDRADIGVEEALYRVSEYSRDFMQTGAAGYFANNWDNAMVPFLESLFKGETLESAYTISATRYCKIEKTMNYAYRPNCLVSVASRESKGYSTRIIESNGIRKEQKVPCFRDFSVAFAGVPGFTVRDWFK